MAERNEQYESLIREYVMISTKTNEALTGLKDAIKEMNHTSVLHTQKLSENTVATKSIEKFWGRIVLILVVAITILAGVEKVGKLLGL